MREKERQNWVFFIKLTQIGKSFEKIEYDVKVLEK
jgi:hypothetical protein